MVLMSTSASAAAAGVIVQCACLGLRTRARGAVSLNLSLARTPALQCAHALGVEVAHHLTASGWRSDTRSASAFMPS